MIRSGPLLCLLVLVANVALPATAAERLGHDEARRAVMAGEIRPLGEILARVKPTLSGGVVGVELKRARGHFLYEIKWVDERGRRHETHVDAATGDVVTSEEDD